MKHIVGVDLGGTNIKAGLANLKGKLIKKISIPTQAKKGSKVVFNNITKAIEAVLSPYTKEIGLGSPGTVNHESGVVLYSPNLPLKNFFMKNRLERMFKLPAHVENDANCFALEEAIFGAGKKYDNVIGVTLGTGLGGGIVFNKKIYHGRGHAGEIGHMTIDYNGLKSSFGNAGDVEEYFSVRSILKEARKLNAKTPKDIYQLALNGNKKAKKIWEEKGKYLGFLLTNVVHSFDPDVIVIGGNLSKAWKFFSKSMHKEIKNRTIFKPCSVVRSTIEESGILGAAALHLQKK